MLTEFVLIFLNKPDPRKTLKIENDYVAETFNAILIFALSGQNIQCLQHNLRKMAVC